MDAGGGGHGGSYQVVRREGKGEGDVPLYGCNVQGEA